jgi:hypothetical protein
MCLTSETSLAKTMVQWQTKVDAQCRVCRTVRFEVPSVFGIGDRRCEPPRMRTPDAQTARQRLGWHGVLDSETLAVLAAESQQAFAVFHRFHTFGDDQTPKGCGQAQHAFDNHQVKSRPACLGQMTDRS